MRRALVLCASVLLAAGPLRPASADHDWNGFHWGRTSNPFTLKIVDSVTGVWDGILPQVSQDWTQSSVLNTTVEAGASGLLDRLLCNPIPGKVRACSANYGPTFWFGLASVWISGGHIVQATTQVNDFYFGGSFGNDTARRHVLCQEIGHDLGLDHSRTEPSCMDDTNSTLNTPSFVDPGPHDYAQLEASYAHTDPNSTVGASAGPGRRVIVGRDGEATRIVWIFPVR